MLSRELNAMISSSHVESRSIVRLCIVILVDEKGFQSASFWQLKSFLRKGSFGSNDVLFGNIGIPFGTSLLLSALAAAIPYWYFPVAALKFSLWYVQSQLNTAPITDENYMLRYDWNTKWECQWYHSYHHHHRS
jgi:hypothetical protein